MITINKRHFSLSPGDFYFIPWDHAITYFPDGEDPFLLAGIHLIPDFQPGKPLDFAVSHHRNDALAKKSWRRDETLTGLTGVISGHWKPSDRLNNLVDYIIKVFLGGRPNEWEMRHLAQLLLIGLYRHIHAPQNRQSHPPPLEKMIQYLENHIQNHFSLQKLATVSGRSGSAVGRLFKKHLRITPVEWLTSIRLRKASQLIASSGLRINEIGRLVGIPDPYYFSKLFKKYNGVSPLKFRNQTPVI